MVRRDDNVESMITIRITSPMLPTRPCKFCLSLQDDSVFADFDVDTDGRVFVRRISFDGFGCCRAPEDIRRMSLADSAMLTGAVERGDVAAPKIAAILSGYFRENDDVIWRDALIRHGLI